MRFFLIILSFITLNLYAHHPGNKIEAISPYPTIDLKVFKDSMDGYNLYIDLKNFNLDPSQVGKENRDNTGHLHLYVNDIKIARVYSKWFHIPQRYFNLEKNLIKVTLNANMHDEFTINEKPIVAEIEIKNN